MHRSATFRSAVLAVALLVMLAGCGGDDPADVAADAAQEDTDAAADTGEDVEDTADDAEDVLEDAGVDADAGGSAELAFGGEMLTIPADEGFGCFISPDGGSQGAVSFEGTDDAGNSLQVSWAGDSPDSQSVSITTADGEEYQTPFGVELDVVIDGTSASVNGKALALADGTTEVDFFVNAECG